MPGCANPRKLLTGLEATFNTLRDMPDAPATFVSVDVCEVVGHA